MQDMKSGDRTGPSAADNLKSEYIDKAMHETQKVVVSDFKIGKQKPVDLLDVLRHAGYGNLCIIQDGLSDDEMASVPLNYIGKKGEDAISRLKGWIAEQEKAGKPTYCIMDDPNVLVKVG